MHLEWTGEGMVFRGGSPGGPATTLDGDGEAGPSPTQALLLSVAACMGIDIVHILGKSRVSLTDLRVEIEGRRAEKPPRRFEAIRVVFTVEGPAEDDRPRLERALSLSEETYCSVLHTLRADLDLETSIRRA